MVKKIQYGWTIRNDHVGIFYYTITDRRSCAIKDHEARQERSWNKCRRLGDKAVKVKIEVIEK